MSKTKKRRIRRMRKRREKHRARENLIKSYEAYLVLQYLDGALERRITVFSAGSF